MTKSKQPKPTEPKPVQTGELPDAALNQAAGGALNAYMPTDQTAAHGSGGGAGKPAMGDGSVKTNSALIGLL
ncbi:MAG TPA: hypothetical protein VHA35_01695 [Dongiaceae bacterium]|jgi:hypothetical protein|nr:hypothetical protein [Dongiaceae bacterium]